MTPKKKRVSIVVVAGGLLCIAAYVSTSYIMNPAIVDQGGGLANSSTHEIRASVGGSVVLAGGEEAATSTNYRLEVNPVGMIDAGYLPPAVAAPPADGGCRAADGVGPGALAFLLPATFACLAVRRRRFRVAGAVR